MSDLTSEQVEAITHAWLDLRGSIDHFETSPFVFTDGLEAACRESVKELENVFPFFVKD
jgi:hypothetical protein